MKATAKKAFSYMKNYAPGEEFKGSRDAVTQLVAAGNLDPDSIKEDAASEPDPKIADPTKPMPLGSVSNTSTKLS